METVADLLEQAQEVGFDLSDTALLRIFNQRYRKMVAEARWDRRTIDVGTTVASQTAYPISDDVVELHELTVDGLPYSRARRPDMIAGRLNRLTLSGYGGVFIPDADESSVEEVTIYPSPSAGLAIVGFASMMPADLAADDTPAVPADFFEGLVNGVIATGLSRDSEQLGAADRFEALFNAEVERLRRLGRRRFRGPGPAKIRVVGINA